MEYKIEDFKKPNHNQRQIIARRSLNPADYLVVKDTHIALFVWDIRTEKVKRIQKWNK